MSRKKELYEQINSIIKQKKMKKKDFIAKFLSLEPISKRTGKTPTEKTVYSWLVGRSQIELSMVPYIAKSLGITEAELLELKEDKSYNFSNSHDKVMNINLINEYGIQKNDRANDAFFLDAKIFKNLYKDRKIEAIVMKGDSMEGYLKNGDIALFERIDRIDSLEDGKYVVSTPMGISVKSLKFHIDGGVSLYSENPAYPPERIETDNKSLELLGKVVGRILKD